MVDFTDETFTKAVENNYKLYLEENKEFSDRIRTSIAEYHMRVAVF